MIIKILILMVILGICPPLVGCIWTGRTEEEQGNLAAAYIYGLFTMLAVFEVIAVPMCYKRGSLKVLTLAYAAALVILIAVSAVRNKGLFVPQWKWLIGFRKQLTPVFLAALVCMLLQAAYVTRYQHIDEDDAYYLGTANTAVATGRLYKYSPYTGKEYKNDTYEGSFRYIMASWPIFIAFLSKASGMHPVVIAHMILPAVILMWVYIIYFLLAGWLYPDEKDRDKRALFMLFVVLMFSFSGYSIYSGGLFPLIRGWQGKAVLAGMGVPALLYGSLQAMKQEKLSIQWFMLFLIVCGAVSFSSMGVALSATIVGCCAIVRTVQTGNVRYLINCIPTGLPAMACALAYVFNRG